MQVIAHRGASGLAPENTLAAVRRAVADGADAVECDVHRTRDGALVVLHDPTLGRTTDAAAVLPGRGPWDVSELTLAELRRLDAGSWWGRQHTGEVVPTLEEWLTAVGPLHALVEVKWPERYAGIEHDLDAVLTGRVSVQSFDHAFLRRFKEVAGDASVGALVGRRPWRRDLVEVASWADQLNPRWRLVTRGLVDRAHELGLAVHPWTVDHLPQMARLGELGVDGLITNHPARLTGLTERTLALTGDG